jgi:DnaJ-class molecular chaperone
MTNKYNIEDEVFAVIESYQTKPTPCDVCEGVGVFKTISGTDVKCMRCHGKGNVLVGFYIHKVYDYKIGIDAIRNKSRNIYYTGYFDDEDSSTEWYLEDDLFSTKEEAQAECDKRNKI